MVGVPGRSKACSTCRRRKKGCDFLRPSCSQCLRAGLQCGGYERGRIFVHTTQHDPSTLISVRESTSTPTPTPTPPAVRDQPPEAGTWAAAAVAAAAAAAPAGSAGYGFPDAARISEAYSSFVDFATAPGLPDPALTDPALASPPFAGPSAFLYTTAGTTAGTTTTTTTSSSSSSHPVHRGHASSAAARPATAAARHAAAAAARRMSELRIVPVHFGNGGTPDADRPLLSSAREEMLLGTFWQSYLPNSSMFPSQAVGYASGGWTNVVQQLYRKDPVLHYTLLANCLSAAARHQGSRHLAEQSLRVHGRALHELRLALYHPQKARSDSVFAALRLMIVFSMFFSDRCEEDRRARARGWKEHNQGVLALLRARGPEAHITGHGHQMFVDCRLPLIIAATRTRKRSPLNSVQWMTIPWTEIPKTPKDRLVDIFSGLPSILEGVDYLVRMDKGKARDDFCRKTIATCWSYDRQLWNWYDGSVPKERLQMLEAQCLADDGGAAMSTEDLSILYCITIYCTACLILYSTMTQLGVTDLPPRCNVSTYIYRIATYLKAFFHPSTGQYGLEMTSFPLGVCLEFLSTHLPTGDNPVEERGMFTQLLETNRGREILDFLRSMLNTNEANTA